MAVYQGHRPRITVAPVVEVAVGDAYVPLSGVLDVTLELHTDEIEVSSHDSGGAREFIRGRQRRTLTIRRLVEASADDSDAGDSLLNHPGIVSQEVKPARGGDAFELTERWADLYRIRDTQGRTIEVNSELDTFNAHMAAMALRSWEYLRGRDLPPNIVQRALVRAGGAMHGDDWTLIRPTGWVRRGPSIIACPDCGRVECWVGAQVLTSALGDVIGPLPLATTLFPELVLDDNGAAVDDDDDYDDDD